MILEASTDRSRQEFEALSQVKPRLWCFLAPELGTKSNAAHLPSSQSLSLSSKTTHPLPTYKAPSVILRILRRPPWSQGSGNTLAGQLLSRPLHVPTPIPSRWFQPLPWQLQLLTMSSEAYPLIYPLSSPLRLACPHWCPRPPGPTAVGPRSLAGEAPHGPRSRRPILQVQVQTLALTRTEPELFQA